ncbi:MAG: hypothetical protein JSR74_11035 [Proteobacteria bacterium]|nr:hypothetical protein [Pseudomonadota bacterium]
MLGMAGRPQLLIAYANIVKPIFAWIGSAGLPQERVHELLMVPARQQKAAIEARAAGHAGGLAKVRNDECGFFAALPEGLPCKGHYEEIANTF